MNNEVAVKVRKALAELAEDRMYGGFINQELEEEKACPHCGHPAEDPACPLDARTRKGVEQLLCFAGLIAKVAKFREKVDVVDAVTNLGVEKLLGSSDMDMDQAAEFVLDWIDIYEGRSQANQEAA